MFLEKIKTPGLAHLSWMIGDDSSAIVVDPRRDTEVYLSLAQDHNVNITHIFETHRNEDLITGSIALRHKTGAVIYHGPCADDEISYAEIIEDNKKIDFAGFFIKALHTPGHTNDSMSYAFFDKANSDNPQSDPAVVVFTGDTLFVGDVGRTDFYPGQERETAGKLYDSLQRILSLGDQAILCPAHGAGSVCGSGMASREFSTLGYERETNPAFQYESKQAFIDAKVAESHYKPPYFSTMERLNSEGVNDEASVARTLKLLNIEQTKAFTASGSIIIDTRDAVSFDAAHIPGSVSLPLSLLTSYISWIASPEDSIVIVGDSMEQARATALHLFRVGFDNVAGAFFQSMSAWAASGEAFSSIKMVDYEDVDARLNASKGQWQLLDVRKHEEVEKAKIEASKHIYLGYLTDELPALNKSTHYTVLCGSGVRATVGASLLKKAGFESTDVFFGSMGAWLSNQ